MNKWNAFKKKIPTKRSKYNAQKVEQDGIKFDSKAERDFYNILRLRHKGDIRYHEVFQLLPKPFNVKYEADFTVSENGITTVYEVKGMLLPDAKIKLKLLKHFYRHLNIVIVKNKREYQFVGTFRGLFPKRKKKHLTLDE